VLKCPDDRNNRVVSAQATYPCGGSAVGGRVCEQWYAAEWVLPESRFELQHRSEPSDSTLPTSPSSLDRRGGMRSLP
jgi:hypothetical protein